jgi:hypothetical protein
VIGALMTTHGDDNALSAPPRLARIRAVVLAIEGDKAVLAKVRERGDQRRERIPRAALGAEGEVRSAGHAVTVRCLLAEGGSVSNGGKAPGNVAGVASAY